MKIKKISAAHSPMQATIIANDRFLVILHIVTRAASTAAANRRSRFLLVIPIASLAVWIT